MYNAQGRDIVQATGVVGEAPCARPLGHQPPQMLSPQAQAFVNNRIAESEADNKNYQPYSFTKTIEFARVHFGSRWVRENILKGL